MSKRVLLAGLFHETHTFLSGTTALDEFSVRRGGELLEARGDGSPLDGVLEVADRHGWHVIPSIDLRAVPSATVADAVLETFWSGFRETIQESVGDSLDGIYLVLHGAMVSETLLDVEGEIITRIRSLPETAGVPICGVLDLHGNISRRTIEPTQGLIAYRSNPHTDSRRAAVDAAELLQRVMESGRQPVSLYEQAPIIWPPTGTGTDDDPMRTLEAMARDIERKEPVIAAVNVFGGFSFADTPDTGVSFSAVTFGDPAVDRRELAALSRWAVEHRELGNVIDPPLERVVPRIREHIARGETPIVIVEPSDNIGGGAPGDGTSILRMLLEQRIDNSAVAINDPDAVRTLSACRRGDCVSLSIGGKGSPLTEGPLQLDVELLSTSNGQFELEDRHSHLASINGVHIDMGPSAVVRCDGVTILLTSRKTPPFDLGQLRSQGLEPERLSAIGVKAAVAHRRAYEKIQRASYTVSTPGPCSSDVKSFPYQHVRRPVYPLDD
ncbi:MAG: M81 family metallopeptidase [Planctomycetaceae bacterium]